MTQPDVHIQVKPNQRVVIHNQEGEAQAAIMIDLDAHYRGQENREGFIAVQFRSHRMISYSAQEWVHPEEGEEI